MSKTNESPTGRISPTDKPNLQTLVIPTKECNQLRSRLRERHAKVLLDAEGGADILGFIEAKILRDIQKLSPEYLTITKYMGVYGVKDRHPYFGVLPTEKGLVWAKTKIKDM